MAKGRRNKNQEDKYAGHLFPDLEEDRNEVDETVNSGRAHELQIRSNINIYTDLPIPPKFPSLILPHRWEALQAEASKRKVPLKPLISPVKDAIIRVRGELRRIQETGTGRLLVISGVTGSGKTTFLNSLQHFIDGIGIHEVKLITIDRRETVENAIATLK